MFKDNIDLVMDDVFPGHEAKLTRWLINQSGRAYDKKGVLAKSTPVEWLAKIGLPIFKEDATAYYCSELVGEGLKMLKVYSRSKVTPEMVVEGKGNAFIKKFRVL